MAIWTWLKNRSAGKSKRRRAIAQAIATRRYDLAEQLCMRLPPESLSRQVYWLQLLVARSRYDEAAQFYEQADEKLRKQLSARGRYLRSLIALERPNELNNALVVLVGAHEPPSALAPLFPYMRQLSVDRRTQAANRILDANPPVAFELKIAAAQILLDVKQGSRAEEVAQSLLSNTSFQQAEVSLLKSNIAMHYSDNDGCVDWLSKAFQSFNMEFVALVDSAKPPSARNLSAKAGLSFSNLPRASIIVSCFNSESSIESSIRSLQAQSHRNIEIIVVDDCSTDGSTQVVKDLMANDARIQLILLTENRGTYHARNAALVRARGEFVLAHDADDWAHPCKVQRLVEHMVGNPKLIAVRGRMIRWAESVGAHFRQTYIRPDFSSLTFRREAALAKAGYFDNVRAGADSEYAYRLQRLFGEDSVGDLKELLSVTAYTPNSLSSKGRFSIDIDTGVFSPARAAYQRAYFHWHEHASNLFVDGPGSAQRPFPISEVPDV